MGSLCEIFSRKERKGKTAKAAKKNILNHAK